NSAVADIGVDLDQEIAPDNHRLAFRMIDVCRDNRATARNFVADELGRDLARDMRAERFADVLLAKIVSVVAVIVDRGAGIIDPGYSAAVFADRDELHFRSDNPLARVPKLGDWMICRCAQWFALRQS